MTKWRGLDINEIFKEDNFKEILILNEIYNSYKVLI